MEQVVMSQGKKKKQTSYNCVVSAAVGHEWYSFKMQDYFEDLFMLPINSREDDCLAGQRNNYRAQTMSGTTLGHIKTCLCRPELNMKTCKWGLEAAKDALPSAP